MHVDFLKQKINTGDFVVGIGFQHLAVFKVIRNTLKMIVVVNIKQKKKKHRHVYPFDVIRVNPEQITFKELQEGVT